MTELCLLSSSREMAFFSWRRQVSRERKVSKSSGGLGLKVASLEYCISQGKSQGQPRFKGGEIWILPLNGRSGKGYEHRKG